MKPFETLSKRGQLQRLRQVGLAALAAHEVPEPRLIPLHHIENTTFRVLAADGQQYVLRIHRPDALRQMPSVQRWLGFMHFAARLIWGCQSRFLPEMVRF